MQLKITRKQAASITKDGWEDYRGRKFTLEFTEKLTLDDLNWSGGTRNHYTITNNRQAATYSPQAPWHEGNEGREVTLLPDVAIVLHRHFCGHDLGITIYLHPCNLPKWLPGPIAVTDPDNETCKACCYNRMSLDGLHEDCDPPMGQCRLELEATAPECAPAEGR